MTACLRLGRSVYLALIFLSLTSTFGYGQRIRVIIRSTGSREVLKERVQALEKFVTSFPAWLPSQPTCPLPR